MYPLFKVWTLGQSICLIIGTGFVNDGEGELGEKEGPVCLLAGEVLLGMEVLEVSVVGPDLKGLGVTFQIVAKFFEGAYDSEEFLVVDIVVLLSVEEGLRVEGNRVPTVEDVTDRRQ